MYVCIMSLLENIYENLKQQKSFLSIVTWSRVKPLELSENEAFNFLGGFEFSCSIYACKAIWNNSFMFIVSFADASIKCMWYSFAFL
jgi:hypothetical protein